MNFFGPIFPAFSPLPPLESLVLFYFGEGCLSAKLATLCGIYIKFPSALTYFYIFT
jgi:hypothetical protein